MPGMTWPFMAPTRKRMPAPTGMLTPEEPPTYVDAVRPVSWKMPVAVQRVCSLDFCMSVLGTESSPLDAAVKTVMSLVSVSKSSCQISWRRLYSLVAALMARFSLRFDSQLMWVRVVTGSDNMGVRARKNPQITLRAFLCSFHRSDVAENIALRNPVSVKSFLLLSLLILPSRGFLIRAGHLTA